MTPVRVMAHSMHSGRRHAREVREVIRGAGADVLLVSGGPRAPVAWRRQSRRLADSWRLRLVTGGPAAGANMILAAATVAEKSTGTVVFPGRPLTSRRGLAAAQLRSRDGVLFGVVSCRLSPRRDVRLVELDHVIRAVARLRGPVIVAGDLNEPPDGPARCRLRQLGFTDPAVVPGPSVTAEAPEEGWNAVLVRGASARPEDVAPHVPSGLIASAGDRGPVVVVVDV